MNSIEINDFSKTFGNKELFSKFNCSIKTGEMVAITGPSGAGKTVLLNTIGLVEPIASGKLFLLGKEAPKIETTLSNRLIRNHISYLFQNFALIDNKTVNENLLMALKYTKHSKEQKERIVVSSLKKVNLLEYGKRYIYELSGGEQQRVALARCLVKPSDIILADEPTGSLDNENGKKVLNILKEINKEEGKTIVIVTHDEYVAKECDKIIDLTKKN